MGELIKIKDMITKYDVSARTLRYYEDMGLISSIRNDDYPYRLYDESTARRLEQILILRKLNISIKDIKRVFSVPGSEIVLDILDRKVADIDDEVALLHELKQVILDFIRHIKDVDFANDGDVKLLYEKAKDIETQLVNVDYNGNSSAVNCFLEVTEKLGKKPDIVKKRPAFSLGFDVARNDKEILEVFAFYEEAFGAIKLSQFVPYNTHIHIIMEIHGIEVLLNQDPDFDNSKRHNGGLWDFDNDEDLKKTIDVLSQDAIEVYMHSWEHWPICAFITDKYGVRWALHNNDGK